MSSEENEDSLRLLTDNYVISSSIDKREVITKCLISEPQCDERRNEIPCCSNDVTTISVINETGSYPDEIESKSQKKDSEFIVIDLTCNVNDRGRKVVGTKAFDCDRSSIRSVDSSQSLVPVLNNEIVNTENQKLVSLSLSILLAALLQAMRCFAQFLENIVVPQR